ncbi:solute carrier family 22 member 7-like [Lingula anatina]|uniref:Solute carrier family 22 member 7-like n=1 Tax=Lingula anatina TaxID=7574 RepID=A0A1S3J109_LINAN|nr:solute carrier family 22 member 7-like [Lingula anatina]|eukprot:XP_013403941.1 solute carrier family 22 member 7-like [Lingula anatina]
MHLDGLLQVIGEFGTYQRRQYFLVCLVRLYAILPLLATVFLAATPKHHCKLPAEHVARAERVYGNLSHEELLNLSIPWEENGGQLTRSSCKLYPWTRPNQTLTSYNETHSVPSVNETESIACPLGLEYSQDIYTSTVVSEIGCGNVSFRLGSHP